MEGVFGGNKVIFMRKADMRTQVNCALVRIYFDVLLPPLFETHAGPSSGFFWHFYQSDIAVKKHTCQSFN